MVTPHILYHSGTEHFYAGVSVERVGCLLGFFKRSIPHSELAGSYASLRLIKEDIQSVLTHYQGCILKRLAVTDAHAITPYLPYCHLHILADPMDF